MTDAECGFAYRTSIFNTTEKNRFVVLAVTYALKKKGAPKIVYKDLQTFFGSGKPTLAETRQAVIKIRSDKSMVINSKDINTKSAGSFFKNPLVSKEAYAEMCVSWGDKIPNYAVDDKMLKIPAAWLIEKSGFQKGYVKRNVGLSTKHTLAIINLGNASANDVLALKEEIQARVKKQFGVDLKPEPIFVGM